MAAAGAGRLSTPLPGTQDAGDLHLAPGLAGTISLIGMTLPAEAASDEGGAATEVDPEALREVCSRLAEQLETGSPSSARTLAANGPLLRQAFGPGYVELSQAVENFDFEDALESLQSLYRP